MRVRPCSCINDERWNYHQKLRAQITNKDHASKLLHVLAVYVHSTNKQYVLKLPPPPILRVEITTKHYALKWPPNSACSNYQQTSRSQMTTKHCTLKLSPNITRSNYHQTLVICTKLFTHTVKTSQVMDEVVHFTSEIKKNKLKTHVKQPLHITNSFEPW